MPGLQTIPRMQTTESDANEAPRGARETTFQRFSVLLRVGLRASGKDSEAHSITQTLLSVSPGFSIHRAKEYDGGKMQAADQAVRSVYCGLNALA